MPVIAGDLLRAGGQGRVDLASGDIVRVLGAHGAVVDVPPCYVLEQAVEPRFKLYETLASAWRTEGVDLAPEVEARLRAAEERQQRYRAALEALRGLRGFTFHKGWRIGALYPRGWVRPSNDVDVHVADVDEALEAWEVLGDLGFEQLLFCSVARGVSGIDLCLGLARDNPFPHSRRAEVVEVSTCLLPGHGVRASTRNLPQGMRCSELVQTALAITEEQFQRELAAKDVLDGAVLLMAMSAGERRQLGAAAAALGRQRQLAALVDAVDATGLVAAGDLRPSGVAGVVGATRPAREAVRRPRAMLARFVQDRILERSAPWLVRPLERRLRGRMTYEDAWRAGLWFFGLPGEGAAPTGNAPGPGEVVVGRRHAVLGTPEGPVPLTPWSEVTEEELAGTA